MGTDDFTLEAWIKVPSSIGEGKYPIVSNLSYTGTGQEFTGFSIHIVNKQLYFVVGDGADYAAIRATSLPSYDKWHQVVVQRIGHMDKGKQLNQLKITMQNLFKLRMLLFLGAIVVLFAVVSIKIASFEESLDSQACAGTINKVERRERGIYYFLVNDSWCDFGVVGGEVAVHVVVGDSIMKRVGEKKIFIYKRDFDGYEEPRIVTF